MSETGPAVLPARPATLPAMDLLDLVIVLLLVAGTVSGWRRGLTWVGFSFAGLIVGVVIGAALAPAVARRFGDHQAGTEALIGTGVFLGCVALLQGIGTAVGYRVRVAALRTDLAEVDSGFGSALAAIGVLIMAWYLGLTFSGFGQFPRLATQINNSAILRALDSVAPRPPAFLAQLQSLLRGEAFPNPFAGLVPQNFNDVPVPTDAELNSPQVKLAETVTAKVLSSGGCGLEAGSAWPYANDYWVTNAHVVAGGEHVQLQVPGRSQPFDATVVAFDPNVDIAVLHAPGIGVAPLQTATQNPASGTRGAVIGYPGGGAETITTAGVKGVEKAQGYNIYGSDLVTREIEVLQARVIPGNSGGPIVDLAGTVIGVVFAASTDPGAVEGYALAPSTFLPDVRGAISRTEPVSTGGCIA